MAAATTLLWLADAAAIDATTLASMHRLLSSSEQARCSRFVRAARRRQFIVGRVLARRIIGQLCAIKPEQVVLGERPGLAPQLIAPAAPFISFSISHSGPWVAVAASRAGAVGLDIECIDATRDVLALAQQAFTPAQVAQLRAGAQEQRVAAFYRLWCEMEARFKLGQQAASIHAFTVPGVQGVLASSTALAQAPQVTLVQAGALA